MICKSSRTLTILPGNEEEQYAYDNTYQPPQQPYTPPPPPMNDPYGFQPQASQFPPPPGSGPAYTQPQPAPAASAGFAPGQTYDPSHFPPAPGVPPSQPPPPPGYNNAYAYGGNQDPNAPRGHGEENVSAMPPPSNPPAFGNSFTNSHDQNQSTVPDGMSGDLTRPPFQNDYSRADYIPESGVSGGGVPHAPSPPAIFVRPPTASDSINPTSVPNHTLNVPSPATPDTSTPRSASVPPAPQRKSVQFADTPVTSRAGAPIDDQGNSTTVSDHSQSHSHHRHKRHRGYEAGDDTDSTPDERRRRSEPSSSTRSEASEDHRHRHHRRRGRSADPPGQHDSGSGHRRDRRAYSPSDSEEMVDLPPRFDKDGKRKPEAGEDLIADKLEEFLSGTGSKLFGNLVDGLLGGGGSSSRGRSGR